MIIKFKGECLNEDWNNDLTVGKEYKLDGFEEGHGTIIDDVGDLVSICNFRISEFEIVGGNE